MPRDDQYQQDDLLELRGGGSWDNLLHEQLRRTPWWAISLSLHLFGILVVMPMIECRGPKKLRAIEFKAALDLPQDEPLEEQPKKLEESPVRDPDKLPVPDPIVSDQPPADHHESPDEEDSESIRGDAKATSDAQMQNRFNNDAIGSGGSAGGTFGGRTGGRRRLVQQGGGDGGTERSVEDGLIWLFKHQSPSGRWDGDGFQALCEKNTCSGVAKLSWADPGLTGLATLAFLGAGHTQKYGRFKQTVSKALRYLTKIQSADGLVGARTGHYMYNHAICALALAEAYGMTGSPLVRRAAQQAIAWLIKVQNRGMGWRYTEESRDNDISVTGWCVMALKSARAAGLELPGLTEAFKGAQAYVESITTDDYYITGYENRPPRGWQGPTSSRFNDPQLGVNTTNSHAANHTPTALATMCRVFFGYAKRDPRLSGGALALASMPPVWDAGGGGQPSQIDYYYWYYATLAMFQMGGDHWRQWNKRLKAALVDHQRKEGHEHGSWDPIDAWGFAGGRVYATAINVLSLEIYYRYARVFR